MRLTLLALFSQCLVFSFQAQATNCLTFDNGKISCSNGLHGYRSLDNTYWNNGVTQYDYPTQGKSYFLGEPSPAYEDPLYDPLTEDEDEDCYGVDCPN